MLTFTDPSHWRMLRGFSRNHTIWQRQTCHYVERARQDRQGRHSPLPRRTVFWSGFTQITLGVQELYTTGIGCAKISVLLMYHRCFPSQRFRICLWAVGTFIAAYSFVQFLVIIFQCTPVRGAWDPSIKASCIHLMLELEIMGILNAITDIITVLLPMPMLWKLQMPLKQKIEVMLTFLVGGFVCIVSVIRVPMEAGISLVDASCTLSSSHLALALQWKLIPHMTDTDVTGCIWSFVELSVAVICACLPTYRPLLRWCVRLVKGEPEKPSNEIETPELSSPPWEKGDYSSSTDRSASDV